MQNLIRNWFLITLVACLVAGSQFAGPLNFLTGSRWIKWMIVALTMVAMTWPLRTQSLVDAVRSPLPALIATFINLILAPLLAWPLSQLLSAEMASGLLLAAAVPSTLASAAVWTRRAGGNDSIALLVTIITNSICFLVTPAWVYWLIGEHVAGFDLSGTILKLLFFVVIPMAVGQGLRLVAGCGDWATANKSKFSLVAQIGILAMVLLGSIKMGSPLSSESTEILPNQIVMVIVCTTLLHVTLLGAGIFAGKLTKQNVANQIAIGFSGSQKTLMVGLSVAVGMGLNIIPIVAYHALQLIIDTLVADRYRAASSKEPANK